MFSVVFKNDLNENDINDWKCLWECSKYKRVYNSYEWYNSCKRNFKGKYLALYVYRDNELAAILPFKVLFGKIYVSPGGRFIDKNSNLFKENNNLINFVIKKQLKNKIIIFKEVPEEELKFYDDEYYCKMSSINPYAKIDENLSVISKRTMKNISKILSENNGDFLLKVYKGNNIRNNINTAFEIEKNSNKVKKHRTIFNNKKVCNFFYDILSYEGTRLFVLKYKGNSIAHTLDFLNGDYLLGCHTAYLDEYSKLLPGKILTYFVMHYCFENNILKYDFSRGECNKKNQFAKDKAYNYNLIYCGRCLKLILKVYYKVICLMKMTKRYLKKYGIVR